MTIVLLHMFAGSARSWDAVVAALRAPCLAPDLRGFGCAPPPSPGARLDDWVDDLAALVAPLRSYVLVGHSMGGKVAMALAARRPAGLARLVLVAPSPPTPEPIPDRDAMLAAHGDADKAADTARQISSSATDPNVRALLVEDSLRTARQAWDWWIGCGSRDDISGAVSGIGVPCDLLLAEDDATLPRDLLIRDVAGAIARTVVRLVPGSRHMMPLDQPVVLAEHIASFAGL